MPPYNDQIKKKNRKSSTILATDCVSFSRMMEIDEDLTLQSLKDCRSIIDPIISENDGRIFHTAGDSVIAEFNRAQEAVLAAINFQKKISERNQSVKKDTQMVFRVGVHSDQVIIEEDNVFGSGVNIAARLESQCLPGQILISTRVKDSLNEPLEFAITSAGKRKLKNISDDFEVFSIDPTEGKGGHILESNDKKNFITDAKPKIAVIPFTFFSKDEDSGFLADGIVEDLITEFSMIKQFDVVSRQSSFNYRENKNELVQFINNFDIDFLVSGNVRSSGKKVRISIELSEAKENKALWSHKYDRVLEDIFDIQDEIVGKIGSELLGEIEISSLNRVQRKPTEDMTSYEHLIKGKQMHHKSTREGATKAIEYFDKAIEADKNNAQAYAWKACTLGQGASKGYFQDVFSEIKNLLSIALELNAKDFECHRLLSAIYIFTNEFEKALEHGKTAYELSPGDPRILSGYGEILIRVGPVDQGIKLLEKALELDPVPQGKTNSDNRLEDLVLGYFLANDYEKCSVTADKIENHEFRSWLLGSFAKKALDKLSKNDERFLYNKEKFKDLEIESSVQKFHIKNPNINFELEKFYLDLLEV